jgi:hypothetical protein
MYTISTLLIVSVLNRENSGLQMAPYGRPFGGALREEDPEDPVG